MILAVIVVYLVIVLLVGFLGHRLFRGTGEDYFLASRTIGPFVLLMTLFGTNMTAFTMLGASGEAHQRGIEVFALMGSSSSLVIPLVFYFVGTRLWWLGKRNGYVTQVQFFRDRYESELLGSLLFIVLLALLLPYLLIGVKGGGDALTAITGGPDVGFPSWMGSLVICLVIFSYVTYGGMRSTAWANTFQTIVFMSVGAIAFFVILEAYGGMAAAMSALRSTNPALLVIEANRHELWRMISYLFMPLSVGVFPHIFSHWLSARGARAFRGTIVLYPICITLVWVPSVVLGVIGNLDFPPPAQGPILVTLILEHAGGILAGCLAAGVFAAIMSSLDSQTLAAGTMFTQDIVRHYRQDRLSESQQVLLGRVFVVSFLAVVFLCSLVSTRSIFSMGVWSLSGFAALFPIIVASLYWKRSTGPGVVASLLTVAALWGLFFLHSLGGTGEYTVAGTGVMPVVVIFVAGTVSLIVVSMLTKPPGEETLSKFFPESEPV